MRPRPLAQPGRLRYKHELRADHLLLLPQQRDCQHALSQIPFTVKQQKPAVLREDYWRPMCMIDFGPGRDVVGRNVFRQLREFRQLHELEWGWQAPELKKLSRRERGVRILNQKPNAVADIAAVLAGIGRGNLMWTTEPLPIAQGPEAPVEAEKAAQIEETARDLQAEDDVQSNAASAEVAADTTATPAAKEDTAAEHAGKTKALESAEKDSGEATAKRSKNKQFKAAPPTPPKRLRKATIYWATDVDLYWAREWSDNVEHQIGLPENVKVWKWQTKTLTQESSQTAEEGDEVDGGDQQVEESEVLTNEVSEGEGQGRQGESQEREGEGQGREAESVEEKPESDQKKKGWLGWLGGKPGGSSRDART